MRGEEGEERRALSSRATRACACARGGRVSTTRLSNRAFILSDIVDVSQKGGEPGGGSTALSLDGADAERVARLIVADEDHQTGQHRDLHPGRNQGEARENGSMTGELLEAGISTQHQGLNERIPAAGRGISKGLDVEQRIQTWRVGRPIYQEMVTIKVQIPDEMNHMLEQLKYLRGIPKGDVISCALGDLLSSRE